jgi:endonuclease YncB( thermonuclease family)
VVSLLLIALLAFAHVVAAAGTSFRCTPTLVWDGDGPIWCAEGERVRLAGVAARELDGSCRPHQPCPRMSGTAARDRLVRYLGGGRGRTADGHVRVRGVTLACRSRGPDSYGRTVAWCRAPRVGDLSCAMVRSGAALRWASYGGDRVCRAP